MVSALITFVSLMLITYLFQTALQADPQNIREFMRSGAASFAASSIAESLVGATNHLWIGPVIGVVLGAVGGTIGKNLAEKQQESKVL